MTSFLKKNISVSTIVLVVFYLLMVFWWACLRIKGLIDMPENYYFGISLGVFAALGGILGLVKSKNWGSFKSYIGKAIIFLSSGFITWGLGSLIIGYYNIALNQSYPYPSLADLAYILSWPLWFTGMYYLSKSTGAMLQYRKSPRGKILAFIIVLSGIIISYYILSLARGGEFVFDTESVLRLFFDFAYPVGDIVIMTSALLLFGLSAKYLGGVFKWPIFFIIFGFFLNYTADVLFTYTNTIGTFYVSNWIDLMYTTTFLFLGIGVSLLDQKTLNFHKEVI